LLGSVVESVLPRQSKHSAGQPELILHVP